MDYHTFRKELRNFPIFSLNDIKKLNEKVYHHRLIEWRKKGYIDRIANGMYKFSDVELNDQRLYYIANRIFDPSYVSLGTALSYYGLIPESVYAITSVTTRKTTSFNSQYATFEYRMIKRNLMFGYVLLEKNQIRIKMAEPEKAILDYFYLNSHIDSEDAVFEMRLNIEQWNELVDGNKLMNYLQVFQNKRLSKRIQVLVNCINHAEHKRD